MNEIIKIVFILLFSVSLYSSDWDNKLKNTQEKINSKDMSYLKSYQIVKQKTKNGVFSIEVKAVTKEHYLAYMGDLYVVGMVVYKDGKQVYDTRGEQISSKRVKTSKGGNYDNIVTSMFRYVDKAGDGKSHEYIISMERLSRQGYYFLTLAHHTISANAGALKAQIVKTKNVIAMIRRDIQKAQRKCKRDISKVTKEIKKLDKLSKEEKEKIDYNSKVAEFKNYVLIKTKRILNGECEVDMGYGKISVNDAQKKILSYIKEIKTINKKLIGDINENNIDSISQKYYDEFNSKDKEKLQKIHQDMLSKVDTLLPSQELLSYFDSLGFTTPKKDDKEAINKWRNKIKMTLKKEWLYSLSTNDAIGVKSELKKHIKLLNKFRDASKLSSDASYDILKANQEYTTDVLTSIPGVDSATDIISMLNGEDLAGRKLTTIDYIMNLTPSALSAIMKNKAIKKAMKKTISNMGALRKTLKNRLAKKLKVVFEKVDTIAQKVYKKDDAILPTYIKLVKKAEKPSVLKIKSYL